MSTDISNVSRIGDQLLRNVFMTTEYLENMYQVFRKYLNLFNLFNKVNSTKINWKKTALINYSKNVAFFL